MLHLTILWQHAVFSSTTSAGTLTWPPECEALKLQQCALGQCLYTLIRPCHSRVQRRTTLSVKDASGLKVELAKLIDCPGS